MRVSMPLFLARRLLALAVTVVLAPTLAYVVFGGLSGTLGESLPAAAWDYVVTTFWHFDLGESRDYQIPIGALMWQTLPMDLAVILGGIACGLGLGLLGGLVMTARPGSRVTRALDMLTAFLLSCPPYWLGFMVLLFFAPDVGYVLQLPFISTLQEYGVMPHSLAGWVEALWVPCLMVGLPLAAQVLRMTASSLREVLGEDFLQTARAKGVTETRILRRHALPVALAPVAALTAANMAIVITNATLMESAFNLPGMFKEIREITSFNDTPVLQGLIIEATVLIVVANMLADAVQARLDPTIR
jgi:ABC-type dipeptide/oligopeptide/nickel transport system permease component